MAGVIIRGAPVYGPPEICPNCEGVMAIWHTTRTPMGTMMYFRRIARCLECDFGLERLWAKEIMPLPPGVERDAPWA